MGKRRSQPRSPVAYCLLFGGEWLQDVSQIDYDIANIDGFGKSSRCRNATEVLIDSGELCIGRRDERFHHQAELLLYETGIVGTLHARNEEG